MDLHKETNIDGFKCFESHKPREQLNDLVRSHSLGLERTLRYKDLPTKEVAKKIIHRSRNFLQCLETLMIKSETDELIQKTD